MSNMKPGMLPGAGKMKAAPGKMAGPSEEKGSKLKLPFANFAGNASAADAGEPEKKGSSLSGRVEDGATVISASFHVTAPLEGLKKMLSGELEALAARVYENGGIIGHIKASTDVHHVQMYSITDEILYVKEGQYDEIDIAFAFILFMIDVDTATAWAREIMEKLINADFVSVNE